LSRKTLRGHGLYSGEGKQGYGTGDDSNFANHHISGWRRNQAVLGKPDFVFPKQKIALFVDGCFWHGCPVHANMPKNNRAFWKKKLQGNKERDKNVSTELRKLGWRVVRVWEHELKNHSRVAAKILRYFDK
jgi:DNA mismatch endonuclease (patch repair protein)